MTFPPSSNRLRVAAMLRSIKILLRPDGTIKQYENNQKSLLNNPQWRKAAAKRLSQEVLEFAP